MGNLRMCRQQVRHLTWQQPTQRQSTRRAFDLFDQFSKDQKYILSDWSTNVGASVEAELCGKLRPISDLMRQAAAVTNCDWGFDPINNDTKLPPYLNPCTKHCPGCALERRPLPVKRRGWSSG